MILLASLLAAVVLIGGNGGVLSVEDAPPSNQSVNLIAFVDVEGRIKTIDPNNTSDVRQISPEEGFFTWPVWSPDSKSIAFSGVSPGSGTDGLTLYLSPMDGGESEILYANLPEMGPILNGMPHYTMWSPDSTRLSFMASEPQGLTLYIDDVTDGDDAEMILRNSPLYAAWSSDSRYMLVHAGANHVLVEGSSGLSVTDLSRQAIGYRTPDWQPNKNKVALLVQDAVGDMNLYLTDVETSDQTLIENITSRNAAFLWSPSGEILAVGKSQSPGGFVFQSLELFNVNDETRTDIELENSLLAFLWSPDSRKLAYLTATSTRGILRWMMLDVESGDSWPLVEFLPTRDQVTMLQFFDQFARSHSLWSPDSSSMVFTGRLQGDGVSASLSTQPAPQIYVMDTGPEPTVTAIAQGFLAFWSPK